MAQDAWGLLIEGTLVAAPIKEEGLFLPSFYLPLRHSRIARIIRILGCRGNSQCCITFTLTTLTFPRPQYLTISQNPCFRSFWVYLLI